MKELWPRCISQTRFRRTRCVQANFLLFPLGSTLWLAVTVCYFWFISMIIFLHSLIFFYPPCHYFNISFYIRMHLNLHKSLISWCFGLQVLQKVQWASAAILSLLLWRHIAYLLGFTVLLMIWSHSQRWMCYKSQHCAAWQQCLRYLDNRLMWLGCTSPPPWELWLGFPLFYYWNKD